MGLPKIQAKAELPGHDVVFLGVPWEGICTWGNYNHVRNGHQNHPYRLGALQRLPAGATMGILP